MFNVSINVHRSAHEIGGNCVEIATSDGQRLLLDAGRPLDTPEGERACIPSSLDLEPLPEAVLLSHAHQDHVGLLPELPANWPVWCGAPTGRLMKLLAGVQGWAIPQELRHWTSGREFHVGPFAVTPLLVDHSAFDAHMLLIRVCGKSILYSGDFRGHGRKASLLEGIVRRLPARLDALVMEGTNLGRDREVESEEGIEARLLDCFRAARGRVFVSWSSMNIDRTVSVFKAARRAGRTLAIDLFSAEVLRSLASAGRIPQPGWAGIKVVVTAPLARRLARMGREGLVEELIAARCAMSARALCRNPEHWVVLSRSSLLRDYCKSGLAPDGDDVWIWSQWQGYKSGKDWQAQSERLAPCARLDIHTSGHATGRLLQDFASRLAPGLVIPVHGERWDEYAQGFSNFCRLRDGERLEL